MLTFTLLMQFMFIGSKRTVIKSSHKKYFVFCYQIFFTPLSERGCRHQDRMVVGFTTTYAIGAYHH